MNVGGGVTSSNHHNDVLQVKEGKMTYDVNTANTLQPGNDKMHILCVI